MGESRGGEGRAAGPPVIQHSQRIVELFNSGKRELHAARITRVTQGIYRVDIFTHGEQDFETWIIRQGDEKPEKADGWPQRGLL